ncbi:glutathionylspermidine synthase family protein [Azospirillum sp. SYSU D00513]|uniref:glutathionylspermidine synthase family protein n=1 Tax=Azospirillum sp. SYSU D00513 TaxID=2812561 RepID=UPI001A971650|nr:glutathionylspermidine synthase family protein [Azospirillum sp. SYSU D00513]
MRRVTMKPRADWRPGLRKYPFGVRAMSAGQGWREDVRYEFSAHQIDLIESVADELHAMLRDTVRAVAEDKLFARLGIRGDAARLLEASWADYWAGGRLNEHAGGLVGRLNLAYDGRDSIKLLGCNYDTPEGLFAAAIVQRNWREALAADADQFNGLHEGLVERWEELARGMPSRARIHLSCATPDPVREGELVYLSATAAEAGIATHLLPLQSIGWEGRRFLDDEGAPISWLGKIYPWEALAEETFLHRLRAGGMSVLSPLWCWLLSNHGLLALLWERYPEHPNLCRAASDEDGLGACESVTVRSFLGLDSPAQRMTEQGRTLSDSGDADWPGGTLWMETPQGFCDEGAHAVLQAWIIGDKCLGMSVRESEDPRVGPEAATVPHLFRA